MDPHPAPKHPGELRRMEHGTAFDMWKDYLGLAAVLAALPQERRHPPLPPTAIATATATATATTTAATTTTAKPASKPGKGAAALATPSGKSLCGFCKHNGEAKHVYSGHSLRDASGRVQCPVLRNYVCPQCGATQDRAHTRRFCPLTCHGYTSVYSCSARNSAGKRPASGRAAQGDTEK
ncbi:LOW QUALITY PROTEIN: nanos homolog 3 [Porphyrio hochstetteri]